MDRSYASRAVGGEAVSLCYVVVEDVLVGCMGLMDGSNYL